MKAWTVVLLFAVVAAALYLDDWMLALGAVLVSLVFSMAARISGAPTVLKGKVEVPLEYQEPEQAETDEDDGGDDD